MRMPSASIEVTDGIANQDKLSPLHGTHLQSKKIK